MQFSSLSNSKLKRSFAEAVVEGLAPDRGLYFPDSIPVLPEEFWLSNEDKNPWDLGAEMLAPYTEGCINKDELREILIDVLNFPIPLHEIENGVFSLELFHGPTSAFKDVGARFLSRVLSRITNRRLTVLVATSGDTGSAVAHGFLGVPNIDVVILYPSGRISKIQEQQLTTAGQNIVALEVEGSFDECQTMVKTAFLDASIQAARPLTSANSINIARWLPQSIYYAWATYQLGKPAVFSVPSGNFGNIAAGLLAAKMGMPVAGFVAATNANDAMEKYISKDCDSSFEPRPSVSTMSNAMDVGDPSNRPRVEALFNNDLVKMRNELFGFSLDDAGTSKVMSELSNVSDYLVCPHTAVGYAGLKSYQSEFGNSDPGVVLATAHPAKFGELVEGATHITPEVPAHLKDCLSRLKHSIVIEPNYEALKLYLLS
jgi:threonine synthase